MKQQQSAANNRWENAKIRTLAKCVSCLHFVGFGRTYMANRLFISKASLTRLISALPVSGNKIEIAKRRIAHEGQRAAKFRRMRKIVESMERAEARKATAKPKKTKEEIKEATRIRWNARYKADPLLRLKHRYRRRIRFVVKTGKAYGRTPEILGCSAEQFKAHIESHFERGMNWSNMDKWDIDHVVPCSSFDQSNWEQVLKCHHYSNLRPMWRIENRWVKRDKVEPCQPELIISLQ